MGQLLRTCICEASQLLSRDLLLNITVWIKQQTDGTNTGCCQFLFHHSFATKILDARLHRMSQGVVRISHLHREDFAKIPFAVFLRGSWKRHRSESPFIIIYWHGTSIQTFKDMNLLPGHHSISFTKSWPREEKDCPHDLHVLTPIPALGLLLLPWAGDLKCGNSSLGNQITLG